MRKKSADYIFPLNKAPIKNGVVIIDDQGIIIDVLGEDNSLADVEVHKGIICPGFVNTHCHLELSYLRGKVQPGTGIADYILAVEQLKDERDEAKIEAISKANQEMINNGIVAVGDIANTNISFYEKEKSELIYHTFIELYGFNPDYATSIIDGAKELMKELERLKLGCSIVPHSPYSVSEALFSEIMKSSSTSPLCIHNQESMAENEMFLKGTGNLMEMKKKLGTEVPSWSPNGKRAINTTLKHFASENNLLLVHNTFTNKDDVQLAESKSDNLYWCFCPNANLHIEDTLPDISMFHNTGVKITLGTDSLASNSSLSILDEMKTIASNYKKIPLNDLLIWSAKHGAEYLGLDDTLGTIEKGKKPGLNLICGLEENVIGSNSKVVKLV